MVLRHIRFFTVLELVATGMGVTLTPSPIYTFF